ncbi:hypothetical protein ACFCYI_04065 [Streptomyces sp. NPDC056257]
MPTTGPKAAPPARRRAPFGIWPADDHRDDEDQEHELVADRTRETST